MLDHVAVHVGKPQCTVRAGAGKNRAAPPIGRRKKVPLTIVSAFTAEADPVLPDHRALDDVVKRLASERMCHSAAAEQDGVPINRRAAG